MSAVSIQDVLGRRGLYLSAVQRYGAPVARPAGSRPTLTGRIKRRRSGAPDLSREEWAKQAKDPLRLLVTRPDVPREVREASLFVWGEVAANAWEHARAPELHWTHSLDLSGRRLTMVARYPTRVFDTEPEWPDVFSERGRGLRLMRVMCTVIDFAFRAGELKLTLVIDW